MAEFRVTERAAARIAAIIAGQAAAGQANEGASRGNFLRVQVLAGGCNGFQYKFELARGTEPDDAVIERAGARVVVDPTSLELLAGAELDYTDALIGAHFAVRNPNAVSSCGCGSSFAL